MVTTCDGTLTGYKALSNTPVASQSFTFTPSELGDFMQEFSLVTLNFDFQLPLETLVLTVTTPRVHFLMDNIEGKFL